MAEVLIVYIDFAEQHYRDPQGQPTTEVRHLKAAIRHVRELCSDALATQLPGYDPRADVVLSDPTNRSRIWVESEVIRSTCATKIGAYYERRAR